MVNVKNKLKKIFFWDYFPFLILFVGMLILHILIKINFGDDLYFKKVLQDSKILDWLKLRYMTWSSRLIIEYLMVNLFAHSMALWRIADVFVIILLGVSVSKLFVEVNLRKSNWIIVSLTFLYPFTDMSSAGWGATTLNYLWPLSFGIYSFIIIKKIFMCNEVKWYEYVYSTLALIFAANQEQMCAILLVMYSILSLYFLIKQKSKTYIFFQTFLCLCSFIFILTCPGNTLRKSAEIVNWFPDYNMLSLVNKLELGFSSSMGKFIFKPNMIFIIFSILMVVAIIIKWDDNMFYIISIVPLASSLFFPSVSKFLGAITQNGIITIENFYSLKSYIPIILLGMVCVCTLLSLYFCFGNSPKALLTILILLSGFVSRIVMGFSPTIWASSDRTFIFMYFSLIICSIIVYNEICKSKLVHLKLINYTIYVLSILSYISNFI